MPDIMEQRTTRLTVLIDPRKKELFEQLCAREDQTPSQVVRRLIRSYIEQRLGRPWQPGEPIDALLALESPAADGARGASGNAPRALPKAP
jgi:hypothetical protein